MTMAPTTNAERQALYRKRLKERASLDAMGARAAVAADHAIGALWEYLRRPVQGETAAWADVGHCETIADFRAFLAADAHALTSYCRLFRDKPPPGISLEEARAIKILADIADAIELAAERPAAG